MTLLRAILLTALLLSPVALPSAFAAESSTASAPATENLRLRVQGYVDAMLNGKKATILSHKDYFSTVFIASSGKVKSVVAEDGGIYRATLVFMTVGRYLQDMESKPHTVKKAPGMGEIERTVTFTVTPASLQWHDRLESPFVKSGKESRYLMNGPHPAPRLPGE